VLLLQQAQLLAPTGCVWPKAAPHTLLLLLLAALLLPALMLLQLQLCVLMGWVVLSGDAQEQSTCGWLPLGSSTPTACSGSTRNVIAA
jgi:hypothetical protein